MQHFKTMTASVLLSLAAVILALTADRRHKPGIRYRDAEREAGRYGRIGKEK